MGMLWCFGRQKKRFVLQLGLAVDRQSRGLAALLVSSVVPVERLDSGKNYSH